jgi:MFS family permease
VSFLPRVLRHPDFRYLFFGQAFSQVGDRVVLVAVGLFVTRETGSPTDVGLVLGAESLALVSLLMFGGVWADRLPRHRVMIATDLVRATLHATVAVLIFTGTIEIWQLVVIEALFGAAMAFYQPAYTGLLPQTIPEDEIQEARGLSQTIDNLAFLLGPVLATVLVLGVGAGEAFAFDSATFVISALLLTRVRPRPRGEQVERSGSVIADLRVGWHEVRSRVWVWATIAAFSGTLLCVFAQWYALAPTIARDVYGSTGVFGVLEATAGGGAVVGAVVAARWRPRYPMRTGLLWILAWPVATALFALGAPLAVAALAMFGAGLSFGVFLVFWESALAHHIPPHALSRVSAWDWMGSLALLPLGYAIAGPLADLVGATVVLGVGSAIGFCLLAAALIPRETRRLRDGAALVGADERDLPGGGRRRREVDAADRLVGVPALGVLNDELPVALLHDAPHVTERHRRGEMGERPDAAARPNLRRGV